MRPWAIAARYCSSGIVSLRRHLAADFGKKPTPLQRLAVARVPQYRERVSLIPVLGIGQTHSAS